MVVLDIYLYDTTMTSFSFKQKGTISSRYKPKQEINFSGIDGRGNNANPDFIKINSYDGSINLMSTGSRQGYASTFSLTYFTE